MREPALEIVFWVLIGAVVYNYLGYPFLLFILSALSQAKSDFLYLIGRRNRRWASAVNYVPRVALLMSVYNEEAVIQAKVRNASKLDYPPDRLEFLIGLDAPTDSTAELLSHIRVSGLRVFPFPIRRGKLAMLCNLVQQTSAEILVFTDANTMLERNCIRNLVRHFADPQVGAVSGEEIRVAPSPTEAASESLYWRYESALKFLENRLNCSLGGNGAALAVRRSLFHPRRQSIVEDFQIPLEVRFQGYRVVYDPEAVAVEEIAPTFSGQFARRVRIGAGDYQTLFQNLAYLNPLKGLLTFSFFSHKVLRWLVPIFLLVAFFCSLRLAAKPTFAMLVAAQSGLYFMATVGYWLEKKGKSSGLFGIPLHFCSMNLALLLGLFRYLSGRQTTAWKPTPRLVRSEMLLDRRGNGGEAA
jgi:cellulose synthase/poly-beta-1,6-N-acetylglucosamine synthase-like glycosyltransferase